MKQRSHNWSRLGETLLHKTRVFDLYSRRMKSASNGYESDFYLIKAPNWVNIIPITPNNEVVMVRQYRFGIDDGSLEIPGGIMDPEDVSPMSTAIRELAEETGYTSSEVSAIGSTHPNPAIQNNSCFHFVARNTLLTSSQNLDPAEDITIHLIPLQEIPELIRRNEITHALVVSAFYFLRHTS